MSKRKQPNRKPHHAAKSGVVGLGSPEQKGRDGPTSGGSGQGWLPSSAAIRETIESVVVAFVLAFLFRTFEAEAFVIPTGSMAPTLMGRHKDLLCDKCGYPYQVSASDEIDQVSGAYNGNSIDKSTCPMCRHTMNLGFGGAAQRNYPSFKGDRILVGKFCYEFGEPKRWDVAVFKYPGEAQTNYIKRLVGLPEETVRIYRGDIFVRPDGEQDFTIARKPPNKLLAMLQPVFDNDYAPAIDEQGWAKPRWAPVASPQGSPAGAWQPSEDDRSFETDGTADADVWLRYEHRVPAPWVDSPSSMHTNVLIEPQLISDFSAYNAYNAYDTSRSAVYGVQYPERLGLHWVGDLALDCMLEVRSDSGQAVLELVEAGRRFQCTIDVASGAATLGIDEENLSATPVQTDVRGPGQYEIIFANCDDQMRVWIDGKLVATASYDSLAMGSRQPTRDDLSPAGVGSRGAALKISHLKIFRDIYYIAAEEGPDPILTDFKALTLNSRVFHAEILSDWEQWDYYFSDDNMRQVAFPLAKDQFLALGDNSAKSRDSRLWGREYYVHRDLLIGKALYIYWPHSWNKLPGTDFPFPFFPNFPRMGLVR